MVDEEENEELPPPDESDSAVDPVKQRRKRQKAVRKEDDKAAFWHAAFQTPIGRAELWDILHSAHTFEERFACGPSGFPQPEATWFEAGIQAFGYRLFLSWLKLDPKGVSLMLEEHDQRLAKVRR